MMSSKESTSGQPNLIRTIGDLKKYMVTHELSPEALARKVLLSHMTIRRMLRLKASHRISEKYWPLFDQLSEDHDESASPHLLPISSDLETDFQSLTEDLEKEGREYQDLDQLKADVRSKMEDEAIGRGLKTSIKALLRTISGTGGTESSLRSRAIAVGAVLYFLNPVDLIPDALVGVGYLDDIAVASVAISAIANHSKATHKDKKKLTRKTKQA